MTYDAMRAEYDNACFSAASTLDTLMLEYDSLSQKLARVEKQIKTEQKRLRSLVKIKEYKTFTELKYGGRVIRATPNSRGEFKVTENGRKLNTFGIRDTIPAICLALAAGNI